MDKNGIGTDATIHEHIKNVQERDYCFKRGINLVPTSLGTSLVEAYRTIGIELYKPYLRAQMEADMKAIADGSRQKQQVFDEALAEMNKIFMQTSSQASIFQRIFSEKFKVNNNTGHQGPGGGGGPPSDGGPDLPRGPPAKPTSSAPRTQPTAQTTNTGIPN